MSSLHRPKCQYLDFHLVFYTIRSNYRLLKRLYLLSKFEGKRPFKKSIIRIKEVFTIKVIFNALIETVTFVKLYFVIIHFYV